MGTLKICAPYVAMVLVQVTYAGFNILMKIALNKGLSQFIFIVYRHLIAMLLLGPLAYFLERRTRPPLSIPILIKIFFLSSFGTTISLNVYYVGLDYTSPTVASALSNVIPGLTFIMALLLRLERLNIMSAKGRARVCGTLLCIGGAMIFTLWKGGYHFKGFARCPLINIDDSRGSVHGLRHHRQDWIKGSLLILTSYVAWSVSLILQALVADVYAAPLSMNTLICFIASLQSAILALFFESEPKLWRLQWNFQLLTLLYAGIINSALGYYLQTWCIKQKGPVFSAMFCPLILVIVGIFSAIFFAERLHLGSLIGAVIIVLGLYTVLWGKRTTNCSEGKDANDKSSLDHQTLEISIANQPLSVTNPTTTRKN